MTEYQKELLEILAENLYGDSTDKTISNDVADEANKQGVLSLIYPQEFSILANNMKVYYGHAVIHKLLHHNNIQYTFLKGYSSAYYYKNPTLRLAGDVDFLVSKSDIKKVEHILLADGYKKIEFDSRYHIKYKKDDVLYEMHYGINGMPGGNAGKIMSKILADIISESKTIDTPYGPMCIPDEFHHGLVILLHTAKHMINSELGLRHLCDWAVFVDANKDFSIKYKKVLSDAGLWLFACQITAVCCKYLGLRDQRWNNKQDEKLLEKVMENILSSGNFGNKRIDNKEKWISINLLEGSVSDKSALYQLLLNSIEITKVHWPISNKRPIIIPFGILFFSSRYLIRMIAGKRKRINLYKMLEESRKRKKLYSEFNLFKIEKD